MNTMMLATNVLLLVLWIRCQPKGAEDFHFNPCISGPTRWVDGLLDFLRPVFPVPLGGIAAILFVVTVVLRAALCRYFSWNPAIAVGTFFTFEPPSWSIENLVAYSLLDAGFFLARFWAMMLVVRMLVAAGASRGRVLDALCFAARPFARVSLPVHAFSVMLAHLALVGCLYTSTASVPPEVIGRDGAPFVVVLQTGELPVKVLRMAWLAAVSVSDGVGFLRGALMFALFGSLVGMILRRAALAVICSEMVQTLMGRFARGTNSMPGGMGIDLTPLIFFFVLNLVYGAIAGVMVQLICRLG